MERFTSDGTVVNGASVRDRMRARAREQSRAERGPYLTPEWLDHSFVLPAAPPDGGTTTQDVVLPSPRAAILEHAEPAPRFERPSAPEVDFAAVVRRADIGRRARIATALGLVLALLGAVVFQVSGQPVVAAGAVVAALVALGGAVVRLTVNRAPVPYLQG